jgi:hypothetical protein
MRNLTRSQRSALSTSPSATHKSKQVSLKYHRLRCQICKHACGQLIEEAFLQWRSPRVIMHCFGIKTETTIYHHAHALGLFPLRCRNLQHALGNIIEDADTLHPAANDILRAIYALAHINDQGQWLYPTKKSEVVASSNRSPASPSRPSADQDYASCTEQPRLTYPPSPVRHREPAPAHLSSPGAHHPSVPQSIASETKSKTDASL